jgi:biphenyl-2,3-diol 1,2-dioxygenase
MNDAWNPDAAVGALGYIGIGVSAPEKWAEFADLLGLMPGAPGPDGSIRYRMDDQAWRIALHPDDHSDDCLYAGFDCGTRARFEAVLARIALAGIAATRDADLAQVRGVMELARLVDPDGVPLELYYGPRVVPEQPFRSPQPLSGFMTGANGLGHMIVNASDPAASTAFYVEVLGLSLSDRILFEAAPGVVIPLVFLHCNQRHHSIAIAPKMPGSKRVHHLMLEVPGINDVGLALDRITAAGLEISATLGRHSNDHMISFYVRTPSGFEVEYGCAGLAVDRATWTVSDHASISIWGHRREHI